MDFNFYLFCIGVLLAISVVASKMSCRWGVPALLIFLGVGMLAGSEGMGGIPFEDVELTRNIGDLALIFILFDGGLGTNLVEIRPVIGRGILLSTLGVLITMLLVGVFAWFSLASFHEFELGPRGISIWEGLLLGAIISSTDASAVFSVLRSSGIGLKNKLQPLLELESGSNDPMAVLLTTAIIAGMTGGSISFGKMGTALVIQLLLGAVCGIAFGYASKALINRLRLKADGLYPVFSIAMTLITYTVADTCEGNGFLSVYLCGIVMGNSKNLDRYNTILSFHTGLSWLMQIIMFLILGLLVFPTRLVPVAAVGVVIAFFLIFIARPISVFLCTIKSRYNFKERAFISWVGLRGAVPIILATFPSVAGLKGADSIFNLIFFVVLTSVVVQGFTLTYFARRLKVTQ